MGTAASTNKNLTHLEVKALASVRGLHRVSQNLYLQVRKPGTGSWIYRYWDADLGRNRDMGLGSLRTTSLSKARAAVLRNNVLRHDGIDPLSDRKAHRRARVEEQKKTKLFRECVEAFLSKPNKQWSNPKSSQQWRNTLETYANPVLGDMPVSTITTKDVYEVLCEIWYDRTETASRLRGRIEQVLGWAHVHGYRSKENPATWRNNLDQLLPPKSRVQSVRHHPGLPYRDVPALMLKLRGRDQVVARALEFTVLTGLRTIETRVARWDEIDLSKKTWLVPDSRMKKRKQHAVPLSPNAVRLLENLPRTNDYVFPGTKEKSPINGAAMLNFLKDDLGYTEYTVHGFRATFKTWAEECTDIDSKIIEAALAHDLKDKVASAYFRGDHFHQRQDLMNRWDAFCNSKQVKQLKRTGT